MEAKEAKIEGIDWVWLVIMFCLFGCVTIYEIKRFISRKFTEHVDNRLDRIVSDLDKKFFEIECHLGELKNPDSKN